MIGRFLSMPSDEALLAGGRALMANDLEAAINTGRGLYSGNFAKAVWKRYWLTRSLTDYLRHLGLPVTVR